MAKAVRQKKTNGENGDTRKRPSTTTKNSPAEVLNLDDAIRVRAYELYQQRGGQHGSDQDDWFRAETEVRNGQKAS